MSFEENTHIYGKYVSSLFIYIIYKYIHKYKNKIILKGREKLSPFLELIPFLDLTSLAIKIPSEKVVGGIT